MAYYQNPRQLSGFYGDLSTTGAGGIPMPGYDPYAVNTVAPLPMPTAGTAMGGPVGGALPTQHRASSGAWNQEDDQTLLALRAMGKNWNQIQREAFPGKTGNACRKRHERLMERRGQNDFDNRKLERLCKEYMSMRKEIWQPLASRCGEKWNVVEMQCMSNGLKNIQSHARAFARRERLESGRPLTAYDDPDGALGCLTPVDDVDVADQSYSSPETGGSTTGPHSTPGGSQGSAASAGHAAYANMHHPHHSQAAAAGYQYGGYGHPQQHHGHGYSNSVSSTGTAGGYTTGASQQSAGGSQGTSPYMGHGGRLPSVGDMGIDSLINRGQGS
ncbi:uncharacterized protein B0T15DRAFT_396222 [Chaetomium strumarium]|uniref:Myb-like domain-containing protein n=1 Tax=Chaetomium strumarium TaxID=1170767 RepID=A0AAJ0GT28_9PEZI|nr:hypothetical protein B0T15DRAFT_396222 [Chaetomium strumarium]